MHSTAFSHNFVASGFALSPMATFHLPGAFTSFCHMNSLVPSHRVLFSGTLMVTPSSYQPLISINFL